MVALDFPDTPTVVPVFTGSPGAIHTHVSWSITLTATTLEEET